MWLSWVYGAGTPLPATPRHGLVQVYEDEPRITQPSLPSVVNMSENDTPPDRVRSRNEPRRESFGWSYAIGGPLSSLPLLCMLPPWKASGSPPDEGAAILAAALREKRLAQCVCHRA
jgi:hypothetical protein